MALDTALRQAMSSFWRRCHGGPTLSMAMTGEPIGGAVALPWRPVSRVVPRAELRPTGRAMAERFDPPADEALRRGAPVARRMAHAADAIEGARCFAERREAADKPSDRGH
jgi:enoyl-CoA hydratase/carnithine racemase